MTVHASVGKLHQAHPDAAPTTQQAQDVADDMFHLKHILPSGDPVNRPGPYERAKERAKELVATYSRDFATDFSQRRQVEARFEIPLRDAVVSGSIDLMIEEDERGNIVDACVIDFKTLEGGENPLTVDKLEWTELVLQVQLYAKAARDVLGQVAHRGHVHLLKDSQRIEVPVDDDAIAAALANVEWAVAGIAAEDFAMRPHADKCFACDFAKICPKTPQMFETPTFRLPYMSPVLRWTPAAGVRALRPRLLGVTVAKKPSEFTFQLLFILDRTFPNHEHLPTLPLQRRRRSSIPCQIAIELLFPKRNVAGRAACFVYNRADAKNSRGRRRPFARKGTPDLADPADCRRAAGIEIPCRAQACGR